MSATRWLVSNGQFRAPWRNRSKPAPPGRTLSDFRRPADQITLSKIAISGGGRLFAIQNTSHLGAVTVGPPIYLDTAMRGFSGRGPRVRGSGRCPDCGRAGVFTAAAVGIGLRAKVLHRSSWAGSLTLMTHSPVQLTQTWRCFCTGWT